MNFQTMNKQRKFILIAAAAGIISVFLPWATISSAFGGEESRNGFRGFGIPAFLGFAVAAAVALMGDQTKTLDKTMWIVSLIAGAISLLFIVLNIGNPSSAFGLDADSGMADVGYGAWMALVASVAIIASAWLLKNPTDNLKSAFDSLKKDISVPVTTYTSSKPNTNTPDNNNTSEGANKIAELERLSKLKENGSISEEEYQQLKSKIL